MIARLAGALLALALGGPAEGQEVACTSAAQCRTLTLEAIASSEFEAAHTLAWRLAQLSARNEPSVMSLLARTQSLSGRADDAMVMLRRLAQIGVAVDDVDSSDDFRRVREHLLWGQLQEEMRNGASVAAAAPSVGVEAARVPRLAEAPVPREVAAPVVGDETSALKADETASVLALPESVTSPTAFAYDAVSQRFIVADAGSDTLKVVAEASGNAVHLVSAGWAGRYRTTALAIDPRRGDLWVTGVADEESVLHRIQLISGRLLETVSQPRDAGATRYAAVAVSQNDVYVLDAAGRRVYGLASGRKGLRLHARLPAEVEPLGLVVSGAGMLVSHTAGLLRVDASGGVRPLGTVKDVDLKGLHSLAWRQGAMLAVQQRPEGDVTVRVRMNPRATTALAVEPLGLARSTAAAVTGDIFYYLGQARDGATAFMRVK